MISKNFCSQSRVLILDDRLLAKLVTERRRDRLSEILNGVVVAAVVFVMILMMMKGFGNHWNNPREAHRPGRVAMLPERYNTEEGARSTYDAQHDSGLPRNEENLWR
jgi:hypothetical protein